MNLLVVAIFVLGVGVSLGASGYGGFLVAVSLVVLMDMGTRDAVAHGLLSFIAPGLIGVYLYWRSGARPRWSVLLLLIAGTVPGTWVGHLLSTSVDSRALQLTFGSFVVVAGLMPLLSGRLGSTAAAGWLNGAPGRIAPVVVIAGALGGVATVVAGIGGPLITVPILLAAGLELTPVIGASLVNAVVAVSLGAWSLVGVTEFDPLVLATITAAQLAGVPIGVHLHRAVSPSRLISVVAAASVVAGLWLIVAAMVR